MVYAPFLKIDRLIESVTHYTLHAKFHVVCDAKSQTLGFAQTHWGTLPQTPLIELPNPSILEGLPRR